MPILAVALPALLFIGALWLLGPPIRRMVERAARRESQRPVPTDWLAVVHRSLPLIAAHSALEQDELLRHARELISSRSWEGCGGLELTDEMRLIIAVQAVLLTWKRTDDPFPQLKSILVYPTTFRPKPPFELVADRSDEERPPALGESWASGTVVLAWDDVVRGAADARDGHNVVLHEFAHQLDTADGLADGVPPLATPADSQEWHRTLLDAHDRLEHSIRSGTRMPIDSYGLTNRAEFFAVATESFFERPGALKRSFPELYKQLTGYYRQDPARRLAEAAGGQR